MATSTFVASRFVVRSRANQVVPVNDFAGATYLR
jgi:hypothetical protein